jgi:hypothetical protein
VNPGENADSLQSGAECGAFLADCTPHAPDLSVVVEAWPNLPEAVRAGIVALAQAAAGHVKGG